MALDFYNSTNPCPVCGGWRFAGNSGEQCDGGVLNDARHKAYCTVLSEVNGIKGTPSSTGKTWRYNLDKPYDFKPEPKRRRRPGEDEEEHPRPRFRCGHDRYRRPPGVPESWGAPVAIYRYDLYDPHEQEGYRDFFRVYRYEGEQPDEHGRTKTFRPAAQNSRGKWYWEFPVVRIPYKLLELLDGIKVGKTIYVVEGEKDVESGYAHTDEAVFTCNSGGARAWLPKYRYARWFEGGDQVVVVADRDESGRLWARDVVADLTPVVGSIRVVRAVPDHEGADLSDHLEAGYGLDDLRPIEV